VVENAVEDIQVLSAIRKERGYQKIKTIGDA
jgi:hypothetical protein